MKIVPIVEGHGEQKAVPELLRRLQIEAACYDIQIGKPVRRHSSDINNRANFQAAINSSSGSIPNQTASSTSSTPTVTA
jgi:hypothetical protein